MNTKTVLLRLASVLLAAVTFTALFAFGQTSPPPATPGLDTLPGTPPLAEPSPVPGAGGAAPAAANPGEAPVALPPPVAPPPVGVGGPVPVPARRKVSGGFPGKQTSPGQPAAAEPPQSTATRFYGEEIPVNDPRNSYAPRSGKTPKLATEPAPSRASQARQLLLDTKLKVLQHHYEIALSESIEAEKAQLFAAPDQQEALALKRKALRDFASRLEDDIRELTRSPQAATMKSQYGTTSGEVLKRYPAGQSTAAPEIYKRSLDRPPLRRVKTLYSAAQATGAPDAKPDEHDSAQTWCPKSNASSDEWLALFYEHPVEVESVSLFERYATGALSRVAAQSWEGDRCLYEWVIWEGNESVEKVPFTHLLEAPPGIKANCIRLEFDTTRINNWQEIDAVELIGRDGSRQWASRADASSSWSQGLFPSLERVEALPPALDTLHNPNDSAAEHGDEVRVAPAASSSIGIKN